MVAYVYEAYAEELAQVEGGIMKLLYIYGHGDRHQLPAVQSGSPLAQAP